MYVKVFGRNVPVVMLASGQPVSFDCLFKWKKKLNIDFIFRKQVIRFLNDLVLTNHIWEKSNVEV